MTWKSITREEFEVCHLMVQWIEVARKWRYGPQWLPTDADIQKSALLERLRNGLQPLPYPPPRGMSCPWYALVEDPGPHFVGTINQDTSFVWFGRDAPPGSMITEKDVVVIWQSAYKIVEQRSNTDYIIRDANADTPYRFHLWFDPAYRTPPGYVKTPDGGWVLQNIKFVPAGPAT